jgi:ATP-binding protein involved in chromosome partitioning
MIESVRLGRARTAMAKIKHKIAVLAGKGGVGKSMATSVIGVALAMRGHNVCILDQDFDGPCIHKMMGVAGKPLTMGKKGIIPVEGPLRIKVISMGNVIKDDEALTWFHQMRRNATEELLCHVDYGEADYLLIDLPPGTSSDSVNIMQYVPDLDGAVVVTIPAKVSQVIAKKATKLCQQAGVRVLGVVENMSGYVCPECGKSYDILQSGGGELLADECDVPFLGKIPLDPRVSDANDSGVSFIVSHPDCESAKATLQIVDGIVAGISNKE